MLAESPHFAMAGTMLRREYLFMVLEVGGAFRGLRLGMSLVRDVRSIRNMG
jgi:hypothetical protein